MSNPWEDVPSLWKDEKAYCNWLRGQIRRVWKRHLVKLAYIKQRPSMHPSEVPDGMLCPGISKLVKKVYPCEICGMYHPGNRMEVDHIDGGKGFSNYEEFLCWQKRILFVGFSDLRHICKECHKVVSLAQRKDMSFDEAKKEQQAIAFGKLPAKTQKAIIIKMCGDVDEAPLKTAASRRHYFKAMLMSGVECPSIT